jgi:hypothetical protein
MYKKTYGENKKIVSKVFYNTSKTIEKIIQPNFNTDLKNHQIISFDENQVSKVKANSKNL